LAQNIVNYRNKHGDFTNKSQLLKVPDFNREDLMLNRGFLTVSGKSGSTA
jgi:transcriptional accessory protein Tex/SPT6